MDKQKLEEIKLYLKVDWEEEDSFIENLYNASKLYLQRLIGKSYDTLAEELQKLFDLYQLAMINECYLNRQLTLEKNEQNIRFIYQSIIQELKYSNANNLDGGICNGD